MSRTFPVRELPTIPTFNNWKIRGGVYVHDQSFHDEVLKNAYAINVITYSFTAEVVDALPVQKLVAVHGLGIPTRAQIKLVRNLHSKLYVTYTKGGSYEIWTGSMNLVTPGSWHNIMVRLDAGQASSLKLYFDKIWNLATIANETIKPDSQDPLKTLYGPQEGLSPQKGEQDHGQQAEALQRPA